MLAIAHCCAGLHFQSAHKSCDSTALELGESACECKRQRVLSKAFLGQRQSAKGLSRSFRAAHLIPPCAAPAWLRAHTTGAPKCIHVCISDTALNTPAATAAKAWDCIVDEAVFVAMHLVEAMLAGTPAHVKHRLAELGADIAIIGRNQVPFFGACRVSDIEAISITLCWSAHEVSKSRGIMLKSLDYYCGSAQHEEV